MGETNVPRFPGRSSRSRRVEGLQEDRSEGANVRDNATRVVSPRLTVQMQSLHSTIANSTVVPSTPGQSRPGRSQLSVMVSCQPVAGRFWRQEGAASALFAVVRE
jgi:hypothetical protein